MALMQSEDDEGLEELNNLQKSLQSANKRARLALERSEGPTYGAGQFSV